MGEQESTAPQRDPELGLMRRVAAAMFAAGGVASALGAVMTQATERGQQRLGATSVMLFLSSVVVLALRRPTTRLLVGMVQWSLFLVGVVLAVAEPIGEAAAFYLWPVVLVAYFCPRRVLHLTMAWMFVTLVVGVALNPSHVTKFDTVASTAMTVMVMGVLVSTMTEREASLRAELARAADTDPLTGLLNRRAFNPRLAELVAGAVRDHLPLSVVMFDLDHFKRLNDEHGHPAGDRALQAVAEVLRNESRADDLVSRFGGEEFAVALPGAGLPEARRYADRVASHLARLHQAAALSTSAGISAIGPDCVTSETLIARADRCLYVAKDAGRDRHASWDGDRAVVGAPFTHAS